MAKSNDIFFRFYYLSWLSASWSSCISGESFSWCLHSPLPLLCTPFCSTRFRFTLCTLYLFHLPRQFHWQNHTNVENKLSSKTKLTHGIDEARARESERGHRTHHNRTHSGDIDCKMKIGGIRIQIWCISCLCHLLAQCALTQTTLSLSLSSCDPAQCLTFIPINTISFLLQHPHPLFHRISQCVFQFCDSMDLPICTP